MATLSGIVFTVDGETHIRPGFSELGESFVNCQVDLERAEVVRGRLIAPKSPSSLRVTSLWRRH